MTRQIDIQGHRGARALFAENTLEGFLATAALGVTAFELDVGMTADGVVVVSHDPALNPDLTRDASGAWLGDVGPAIHALTHAALCRYDVGRARPGSRTALLFPDQASTFWLAAWCRAAAGALSPTRPMATAVPTPGSRARPRR